MFSGLVRLCVAPNTFGSVYFAMNESVCYKVVGSTEHKVIRVPADCYPIIGLDETRWTPGIAIEMVTAIKSA